MRALDRRRNCCGELPAGPVDIRDTKLPGFVLRVRPSGTHTYFANWTPKAPARQGSSSAARLGALAGARHHGCAERAEAREEARKVLADVARGDDPIAARAGRASGASRSRRSSPSTTTRGRRRSGRRAPSRRRGSARLRPAARRSTARRDHGLPRRTLALRAAEGWQGRGNGQPRSEHAARRAVAGRGVGAADRASAREGEGVEDGPGRVVRYLSPAEEKRLRAALTARDDQRRAERATGESLAPGTRLSALAGARHVHRPPARRS